MRSTVAFAEDFEELEGGARPGPRVNNPQRQMPVYREALAPTRTFTTNQTAASGPQAPRKFETFAPEMEPFQFGYRPYQPDLYKPARLNRRRLSLAAEISGPIRNKLLVGLAGILAGWFFLNSLFPLVGPESKSPKVIYAFGEVPQVPTNKNKLGDHNLVTGPSIEVSKINAVLGKYHSPAMGSGQAFYELGVRYGIDPAYALAFFIHESSAGTKGVATVTRSIGNIRCTPGYDCYQTPGNGSFRRYLSWEAGMEDWYKLIKELYVGQWGLKTLEQIIPVYAPSADHNSPSSYIQQVASMVDSWRTGKV